MDLVPPGHGESAPSVTSDRTCWCGRALVSQGARRWSCPRHGYARFVVMLVQQDGNPREVYRSTELELAFKFRDDLRQLWDKRRAYVGVTDEDDGERGWLEQEDE